MFCGLCRCQCIIFAFSIAVFLKELCDEICQNSNIGNCRQIEWNMLKMKITAQNTENEKEGTDGQTVKKIKTDWNCGFSKLANSLSKFILKLINNS